MNVPETFFSVSEQINLFLLSCISGVAIGVCYDFFRAARILFPHNTPLVVIEDVIFMAGYAVFLSSFATVCARGELRFYHVIGNAIGFLLYFFTIGNIFINIIKKLYYIIIRVLKFISAPVRSLYVKLQENTRKFVGNSENSVKNYKKNRFLLLNILLLLYNKKENKERKNVKNVAEKKEKKVR